MHRSLQNTVILPRDSNVSREERDRAFVLKFLDAMASDFRSMLYIKTYRPINKS